MGNELQVRGSIMYDVGQFFPLILRLFHRPLSDCQYKSSYTCIKEYEEHDPHRESKVHQPSDMEKHRQEKPPCGKWIPAGYNVYISRCILLDSPPLYTHVFFAP